MPPINLVCSSWVALRKSGVWHTSHSRIRLARSRRAAHDELVGSELAQRRLVLRFVAQSQPRLRRRGDQRFHQGLERGEIQLRVAPLGGGDRRERMAFDRGDDVGVDVGRFAGHPKGAVLAEPPGAAGDLPDLLGIKPAQALAVELAQAGEGDMVDVHVEAHADRVGGDEEIDLAGLKEFDLRIAGARGKRAHHHRRAAALAADQLGDRVDLVGGEGDDRRCAAATASVSSARRRRAARSARGSGFPRGA